MISRLLVLMVIVVGLSSCGNNTNPPEYIKQVVAYKEGSDGLMVYVVLADKDGNPTSADALIEFIFEAKKTYTDGYVQVWHDYKTVKASDFTTSTVGIGALEHKVLLYSLGRITYDLFTKPFPWKVDPDLYHAYGRVRVSFYNKSEKKVEGEARITF